MESEKCNDKDGRLLATTLDDGQACGVGLGLQPVREGLKRQNFFFFSFFLIFVNDSPTIRLHFAYGFNNDGKACGQAFSKGGIM